MGIGPLGKALKVKAQWAFKQVLRDSGSRFSLSGSCPRPRPSGDPAANVPSSTLSALTGAIDILDD